MKAWRCQFEKPTISSLLSELGDENEARMTGLRQSIRDITGIKPKLDWHGITWCWSETTSMDSSSNLLEVQFIPDPESPRIGLTLSTVFFEKHHPTKLPKSLYPGLTTSTAIGHRSWCEFAVQSDETAQSISELLTLAYG